MSAGRDFSNPLRVHRGHNATSEPAPGERLAEAQVRVLEHGAPIAVGSRKTMDAAEDRA